MIPPKLALLASPRGGGRSRGGPSIGRPPETRFARFPRGGRRSRGGPSIAMTRRAAWMSASSTNPSTSRPRSRACAPATRASARSSPSSAPCATSNDGDAVATLELEHYPGMTEKALQAIVDEARARFDVLGVRVVHRVGRLAPTDAIVLVAVTGAHRGEAFDACRFVMDYLKTRAPFWKKERTPAGERWVEARASDDEAADALGRVAAPVARPLDRSQSGPDDAGRFRTAGGRSATAVPHPAPTFPMAASPVLDRRRLGHARVPVPTASARTASCSTSAPRPLGIQRVGDRVVPRRARGSCSATGTTRACRASPAGWSAAARAGSRRPTSAVPASLATLADGIVATRPDGELAIVPGLITRDAGGMPDVMRGEETQIVGAVAGGRAAHARRASRHARQVGARRARRRRSTSRPS